MSDELKELDEIYETFEREFTRAMKSPSGVTGSAFASLAALGMADVMYFKFMDKLNLWKEKNKDELGLIAHKYPLIYKYQYKINK